MKTSSRSAVVMRRFSRKSSSSSVVVKLTACFARDARIASSYSESLFGDRAIVGTMGATVAAACAGNDGIGEVEGATGEGAGDDPGTGDGVRSLEGVWEGATGIGAGRWTCCGAGCADLSRTADSDLLFSSISRMRRSALA